MLSDGRILFKETNSLSYEDLSQLFFAEFAKQCDLEHVNYDLAILYGKKGVITPDFTKEGELLISGESLITLLRDTYKQNIINQSVCNSVESIREALKLINVSEKLINTSCEILIKRLIFDSVLLETDRNSTNFSFITAQKSFLFVKDHKNNRLVPLNSTEINLRLAPIYDGSNIFGLNRNANDIQTKVKNIRDVSTIYSIIANSKRSFFFNNETQNQSFIQELQIICQSFSRVNK